MLRTYHLLLLVLALVACSKNESYVTVTHPSGLSLRLPAALQAERHQEGFRIAAPNNRQLRHPLEVDVHVERAAAPSGAFPRTRTVGGREVHYRVESEGEGSGGGQYLLSAWTSYGGGHVFVRQSTQAEPPAEPDFSLAWTVLEGITDPIGGS